MQITTILAMPEGAPDALASELSTAPGISNAVATTEHGLTTLTCETSGDGVSLVRRIVSAHGGIVTHIS